ncbi:unnamed protein product, partial [Enterobius vermicularis]|uniref:Mitochondrial fission 1 protein n=1 Tax=Enterobius vermicularis TaxID=51028 RepID=A0A0N4VQT2_ENTVE
QSSKNKLEKNYKEQASRGPPSAVATFSYAHGLIKSSKSDVRKGINLLEGLLHKDTEDIAKRDYVYYLAVAHTRLKEYDRALAYIEVLLSAESSNRQAIELKELIQRRMRNDGLLGMAILGGGVAVVGGLIIAALAASKRH